MALFNPFSWLLCLLATCLPIISAQLIYPTYDNSTVPTSRKFILVSTLGSMKQSQQLDPLTDAAGAAGDLEQLKDLHFRGPLILVDSPDTKLTTKDLAFIRCDPSSYAGGQQMKETVAAAAQQNPQAIVLYSVNYGTCRVRNFDFKVLYTTTEPTEASLLEQVLRPTRDTGNRAQIGLMNQSQNSGDGNGFMKSPTTAVAMIILYSITGIITALFLVIIVVGAIRAHRHPERYWPRNEAGRPRQSRAKGIARAMLETIPIVKFGDREDEKRVGRDRDVELENGTHPVSDPPPANAGPDGEKANGPTDGNTTIEGPELVTTETAAGVGQSTPADASIEDRTDSGLACSVCTDDFVKGQDIRVLPCNHKFHPECIDPWLLNVSGTCPLCRIDLRPVTSRPEAPADSSLPGEAHLQDPPPAPSTEPSSPPTAEGPNAHRRSRAGLSMYIQNTLNRRRMRDATPEERIAALRQLRTVNGALPSSVEARPTAPEGQRRRRLSARLSRAWGTSSRPTSTVHATPLPEQITTAPLPEQGPTANDHETTRVPETPQTSIRPREEQR